MEMMAERLQGGRALNEQQQQAIELARGYFDRRLQGLGAAEGKSESDIRQDLQKAAEQIDAADSGRIAIDCLRRLQDAG